LLLVALLVPVGLVILYRAEPTEASYYPRCPFHQLTGLHCAGCGTTRCLHALLHGEVRQALAYNALTFLALPYLVYWFVRESLTAFFRVPPARPVLPRWCIRLLIGLVFAFWVVRNLGFPPFDALAPHRLEGRAPAPAGPPGALEGRSSPSERHRTREASWRRA
jgi:hypothetical protein